MIGYRLAAALAVATLAVPVFAQVKKVDVQGVQNFNQIDAVFACGGATDATGVANLKKQGFASIISFRLPTEQGVSEEEAAIKTAGIKYVHLPLKAPCPIRKSPTNSWRPYPTRAISRLTSTVAAAAAPPRCG